MSELVERLRWTGSRDTKNSLAHEAADRIEELECALREVAQSFIMGDQDGPYCEEIARQCHHKMSVARAAIEAAGAKVVLGEPVGYIIGSYLDERREEYERNGTVMYARKIGSASTPLYAAPSFNAEEDSP